MFAAGREALGRLISQILPQVHRLEAGQVLRLSLLLLRQVAAQAQAPQTPVAQSAFVAPPPSFEDAVALMPRCVCMPVCMHAALGMHSSYAAQLFSTNLFVIPCAYPLCHRR